MAALSQTFDVTARKVHQAACVALLVAGFVIGIDAGRWLVALVGVVMLAGRFWWPADVFRQLTWRFLEPSGLLRRRDVPEDHDTRRVARVLGGVILLAGALLLGLDQAWAWIPIAAIGAMIFLDAAFDLCVLCAVTYRFGRLTASH